MLKKDLMCGDIIYFSLCDYDGYKVKIWFIRSFTVVHIFSYLFPVKS